MRNKKKIDHPVHTSPTNVITAACGSTGAWLQPVQLVVLTEMASSTAEPSLCKVLGVPKSLLDQ